MTVKDVKDVKDVAMTAAERGKVRERIDDSSSNDSSATILRYLMCPYRHSRSNRERNGWDQ